MSSATANPTCSFDKEPGWARCSIKLLSTTLFIGDGAAERKLEDQAVFFLSVLTHRGPSRKQAMVQIPIPNAERSVHPIQRFNVFNESSRIARRIAFRQVYRRVDKVYYCSNTQSCGFKSSPRTASPFTNRLSVRCATSLR